MEFLFLVSGISIYLFTVFEIVQTTLSMQGGGFITKWFSHGFWTFSLKISGGDGRKKILSHAGYILLISIVLIWVFLLWLSLVLLLLSNDASIINSSTKEAADIIEKIYYAGFTLSTLGVGDYVAGSDLWRLITVIYSFTGLILLTMSVTYFIPVLSAIIDQRKLGIRLSVLGNSPEEILLNVWDGKGFKDFNNIIDDYSEAIIEHSQNHRAYPIVHYFHNWKKKNAVILQLARLYEAYYILKFEISEEKKSEKLNLKPLDLAFQNYKEVIKEVTPIKMENEAPPLARADGLRELGIVNDRDFDHKNDREVVEMRRLFKSLVKQDGWQWKMV